jgi:hypothetical protein
MNVEQFAGQEPRFRLEEYFAGKTRAWGLFEDRFGNLRRQFVVDIDGSWDGKVLTLVERFRYTDGETGVREWSIEPRGANGYEGRASDIVGTASGSAYGNALNWRYEMDLVIGGRPWRVAFDDWMFLQEGNVLLNRAAVTKWGIELGTVTIAFTPADGRPGGAWAGASARGEAMPPAALAARYPTRSSASRAVQPAAQFNQPRRQRSSRRVIAK